MSDHKKASEALEHQASTDQMLQRKAEESEQYAIKIKTASEIAKQAGTILEPQTLLETVIPLIKERFNLYHVHVYTVDNGTDVLDLAAGYGEAGAKMVAEGHSIPLDAEQSLVARAARTKQPILVDDVSEDPDFLPNPLLPDTQTEVAVPAIAGGEVLGVFDVQHDEAHTFTDTDLDVFLTLAGQIANVFQNAQLFEEQRKTEAEQRKILSTVPVGIAILRMPKGEVMYVNPEFTEILGYSAEEIQGQVVPDFYYNEADAQEALSVMQTQDGILENYEVHAKDAEGNSLWISLSTKPIQYNGEPASLSSFTDITERKEAERALDLARTSIEGASDAFFWFDTEANFVDVSDTTCHVLGYTREELLDMRVFDVDPVFPEEAWPDLQTQVKDAGSVTLESQHQTKDGHTFPVQVTVSHLEFAGEDVYFSIAKDITEQKEIEATLAQSEAQHRSLIESMQDGVFIIQEGRMQFANEAFAEIVGYPVDEIEGMNFTELVAPEDLEKVAESYRKRQAGEPVPPNYEWRMLHKDGRRVWVSMTVNLIELEGQVASMGTVKDITISKEAEEERRRFTTRLETAAEISEQVGSILDPDELLQTVIPLIKERFGLYYVHVYTVDQESGQLKLRAGYGEPGEKMLAEGHSIPLDAEQSLVARAVREKAPILVDDVTEDPNFLSNPLLPDTKTEVAVPAIAGGEVLGVFDVQHDEAHTFTDADLDVFLTLASQIANAFRSAGTIEQTRTRLRVSEALAETNTQDDILNVLIQQASLFPEAQVALMLVDTDADELTMEVVRTETSESELPSVPEGTRFTKENLPALEYLSATTDFVIQDVETDERMDPQSREFMMEMGIQGGANIPLTVGDTWLGELVINTKQKYFFDKQKLNLYHTLAEQGASTLWINRLHEATAESERRYSTLLGSLRDGFAIVNMDGYVTNCNAAFEEIVGYTLEELKQIKFQELTAEEYREKEAQILEEQALTHGRTELYEKEYIHKDGHRVPVELSVYLVESQDGQPIGFWGFIRDITERKRAQTERERFTQRLETAAEISEQVGSILDPDELLQTVIPLIKERFGLYYVHVYTVDKETDTLNLRAGYGEPGEKMLAEGHSIPLDAEQSLVARAARAKAPVLVDDVTENPDFMPNPLLPDTQTEVAVPAIAGGEVLGVFDVQHDEAHTFTDADLDVFLTLTGQIANAFQSTALLEEAEQERDRAQRYLELAGSVIVALDTEAEITLINQAGCEVLGYPEEELLGQNWFDLVVPAGLREEGKANFPKLIAGEVEPRPEYIAPVVTKSGEERVVNWHDSVLWDDSGNITGTLSSGEDITERLQAEEQIKIFQTLTETSADGILMADLETQKITYANQAAHILFGCDYESHEMIGKDGAQFWAEEELPRLPQILEQTVKEGWQGDVQQRRLDDTTFAANVTTFVLRDAENRPTDIVIMVRDITERRQRETFLQEQSRALAELAGSDDVYSGDLKTAFETITEAAAKTLNIKRSSIWLYDPTHAKITCADLYAEGEGHTQGVELTQEDFPSYFKALEQERIIAAHDAHTHPHTQEFSASYLTPLGISSMLDAPIRLAGEMIGVLCNENVGSPREWSWEEQAFSASVADFVASAMEAQERKRFSTQLSTASEIATQVNQILDPDKLLREVVTLLKERFDLYHAHVYTLNEEEKTLDLRFGYGRAGKIMLRQGHTIPRERKRSLVAQAARTKTSVLVNDVTADPNFMPNALLPDTKAELAVPLVAGNQILGVFDVQAAEAGHFTDVDVDVFETLAGQITTALENAELFERQERAEAAMRESAEKIRAVFDAISDGIGVSNMMGEITDVNEGLLNLYGYDTREEIIGRNTMDLIAREDWSLATQGINQTLTEGRSPRQEINLVRAEGDKFIGEVGASLLYDEEGEPSGIISVIRDITERKEAERALEMTRTSVETSSDAFYWFDADANFIDVNQGTLDLLGYTREEILNLKVFDVDPTFPRKAWPGLKEQVKTEGAIAFEGVNQTKDGQRIPVNVVVSHLPFEDQEIYFSIARDISEEKAARETILQERNFSDTIINGLPGIFYLYDGKGNLVRWNENFQQVLGYSDEELRQRPATDFIAEDDRALIASSMEKVYLEGQADAEARLLLSDGRQIPYYFTGIRAIVDGEPYLAGVGIDMSAQKEAQEAIQRSRERLSRAQQTAHLGSWEWDLTQNQTTWSDENYRLSGYEPGAIEPDFETFIEMVHPEDRSTIHESMDAIQKGERKEDTYEYRILLPDGGIRWIEGQLEVISDEAGEPQRLIGTNLDITERKRAEEQIRESQQRLSLLVQQTPLGVIEWNTDFEVVSWNPAAQKIFGYTEEEAMGRHAAGLIVPEEVRSLVNQVWENLLNQTGGTRSTNENFTKDGRKITCEWYNTPLADAEGNVLGVASLVSDITARKRAAEERERFTVQLGTAAEIATRAGAILDPNELLAETVNLLCERFDLYHSHVYTIDEETLRIRAGYGKAGQVMLEEAHTIPLQLEQSLVARAARNREIVVANDVTQEPGFMPNPLLPETKAEIAVPLTVGNEVLGVFDAQAREVGRFTEQDIDVFRTLAGQLATAVQNAIYVEQLQRTTNRLREVDRLKSEFLANMSHELRTPLNSIIGYAEIMMMGIDGTMDPETLEDVRAIYENGQHLLAMINDILDLAKIEAGRMTLKFEENVDVAQILEEVETSNASLFNHKPVEFQLVIEEELPGLRADRIRLHQIFNNLISNAQKFTEEGYVTVEAYSQGSHWVCVSVEDTGIGIAKDEIDTIFERFEQVDGSSTRQAEGTGLGLAITRELVQMHGGRIEVESELNQGSKFTVWLPIEE